MQLTCIFIKEKKIETLLQCVRVKIFLIGDGFGEGGRGVQEGAQKFQTMALTIKVQPISIDDSSG